MRILVADQNALLLAAIVRTFGRHCEVVVATRRDACMAHLEERKVDVVVACEKLRDYTGLELLSEVAGLSPDTVRIFAARPETLKRLGARLDYFGLLGTLSYPIDARKLLVALKTARGKRATPPKPLKPKVQHVVLDESEWDTGERLGLLERELETAYGGGALAGVPAAAEPAGGGGDRPAAGAADRTGGGVGDLVVGAAKAVSVTPGSHAGGPVVSRREDVGVTGRRAAAWDVEVVESAAWGAGAVRAPVAAPRRTPGMTEDASFEVSFDEMPGAIAVAVVVRGEPKAAAQGKSSGAAPRTDKSGAAAAGGDDSETFEVACNDPDIDAPLPVETFGAANEPLFDEATRSRGSGKDIGTSGGSKGAVASSGSVTATGSGAGAKAAAGSAGAKGAAAGDAKKSVPQRPKVRKPTVPTAAQREAFQRAVARRNAARRGGGFAEGGGFGFGTGAHYAGGDTVNASGAAEPFISTRSLSDLAKMAGKKQPLKVFNRTMAQPKRRAIVYGSGVVAAVLAAVVFQLMRATPSEQERHRHAQDATAHLFSPPSSLDAGSNSPPPQVFTPTPHVPASQGAGPQPQTFDPNTAPEDPPPPPAYQGPGPLEPPSMVHNGPPLGMRGQPADE